MDGDQGDSFSQGPLISAGGRFVAFSSDATNLVPNDTNGTQDVFVRDRQEGHHDAGEPERGRCPVCSPELPDGNLATRPLRRFQLSLPTGLWLAFHPRPSRRARTRRVSLGIGRSQSQRGTYSSRGSPLQGRFLALTSIATNLVPDDTNDAEDVSCATGGRARPAGERRPRRRPRQRGQPLPGDFGGRALRSLLVMPPTWCRATPTTPTTCSSMTARRARPDAGQASRQAVPRAN